MADNRPKLMNKKHNKCSPKKKNEMEKVVEQILPSMGKGKRNLGKGKGRLQIHVYYKKPKYEVDITNRNCNVTIHFNNKCFASYRCYLFDILHMFEIWFIQIMHRI